MKKTLLGTTALVAAAVVVSGAHAEEMAAEPISLSVGGNSHWGIAVSDNDAATENDDIAISADVEINFKGSTVLDSGLEVGVRMELEGETASDQMDETYAYISGSFGTIRIGNDDAASAQMSTGAPYATWFYGLNTPYWSGSISSGSWLSTLAGIDIGDSASLMYFSPRFNGFQFGLSYAPEAGAEVRGGHGTADQSEGNDAMSIGANYSGSFGDAGVYMTAGYMVNDKTDGTTVNDTSVGLQVSMADVSVGGSYRTTDMDDGSDDKVQFDAGVSYSMGALTVSANIGSVQQDGMHDTDMARLLANYNLGPGINLAGALGQDSNMADEDTTFAGVALGISF